MVESDINYRKLDELFVLNRTDPYGFWSVSVTQGRVPAELNDQQFTTVRDAVAAVKSYKDKVAREISMKKK